MTTVQLDVVAKAILPHLGCGWTLADEPRVPCLLDGSGKGLHLSAAWPKNRITITGHYPDGTSNGHTYRIYEFISERPSITVAPDRKPEAIVNDVMRRLWPEYLAVYERWLARLGDQLAYQDRTTAIAHRLAAVGLEDSSSNGDHRLHLYSRTSGQSTYGDVTIFDGYVNMDLRNIRADVAEQVLKVVVAS